MSLEKYGINKPKQRCFSCYEPINPDSKDARVKSVGYNEKIECKGCGDDSICIMCSWEYDGKLLCEKCFREIEKGEKYEN